MIIPTYKGKRELKTDSLNVEKTRYDRTGRRRRSVGSCPSGLDCLQRPLNFRLFTKEYPR